MELPFLLQQGTKSSKKQDVMRHTSEANLLARVAALGDFLASAIIKPTMAD